MFKIHTKDGQTTVVNLSDKAEAANHAHQLRNPNHQKNITGVTALQTCNSRLRCPKCGKGDKLVCTHCGHQTTVFKCSAGVQYSLARPSGFENVFYLLEDVEADASTGVKGGQRITCFADDVRITIMAHAGQPAARVTLTKMGKQRYNPFTD